MESRAETDNGQDNDPEITLLKPENNVPDTDQRTHVVLTDERFIENLARCPKGVQKDVSAVMLYIKGCMDEIRRLKVMEKLPPDARGNVRVLKDTTTYMIRRLRPDIKHPAPVRRTWREFFAGKKPVQPVLEEGVHYDVEKKTVGIYTVLPAVQIPLYRRKFERQTAQGLDWVWRMMRLWIGEDGKGRTEMIDALQASNGKLMPAENGRVPMIFMNNGAQPGGWPKNR